MQSLKNSDIIFAEDKYILTKKNLSEAVELIEKHEHIVIDSKYVRQNMYNAIKLSDNLVCLLQENLSNKLNLHENARKILIDTYIKNEKIKHVET